MPQFLHAVCDELCHRSHGYHAFGSATELTPVVSTWKDFIARAVGRNLPVSTIQADLVACGAAADTAALAAQVIDGRRAALRQALTHDASAISSAHLTDFDWSLQVR